VICISGNQQRASMPLDLPQLLYHLAACPPAVNPSSKAPRRPLNLFSNRGQYAPRCRGGWDRVTTGRIRWLHRPAGMALDRLDLFG